jgi:membrane-associated phospholipid phosphatase
MTFRLSLLSVGVVLTTHACSALAAGAQAHSAEPLVSGRDVAWLGAATVLSLGVMQVDARIARASQDSALQKNSTLRSVYDGFNPVNEKSLFAAGVLTYAGARIAHAQSTADIALHTTEAVFISGAIGTVARGILGRSRPFVSADRDAFDYKPGKGFTELKYRSFPSLHSSAAMATAAAVATELRYRRAGHRKVVTPLLYVLASGPGLIRIYGDKHWTSDVLMGGALGVVTGNRTVRYAHGHPRNRVDRWLLGHASAATGTDGPVIALGWQF